MQLSKILLYFGLAVSVVAQTKIKIMPLGDSITEITCWRALVWDMLVKENLASKVDFVGTMSNNPASCRAHLGSFDLNHEGHSGWLSINIANQYIQGWLSTFKPDIVQFMLGTNDVSNGRATNDIVASYTKIIGLMRQSNPRMKIIVDQLIPLSYNMNGVNAVNAQIPNWARSQNSTNSPILLADCSTAAGYTLAMNKQDGVHPNEQGDQFIANKVGPLLIKHIKDLVKERGL
ncbi:multidomain esterase [Colletotrichum spaethianum]|uniref:Multidomain esterase n=1 Tax=Colletotrichum spaethianum TaxID=700344 RepID=A0AA37PH00_9PEZI|nr:multidomain esterase [Colletotrichum spaethianum]GKT52151.1 multidomain esterase [Colletotrichum spaethianum]